MVLRPVFGFSSKGTAHPGGGHFGKAPDGDSNGVGNIAVKIPGEKVETKEISVFHQSGAGVIMTVGQANAVDAGVHGGGELGGIGVLTFLEVAAAGDDLASCGRADAKGVKSQLIFSQIAAGGKLREKLYSKKIHTKKEFFMVKC